MIFKESDPVSDIAPLWQSTARFSISLTKQVTSKKPFPNFQVKSITSELSKHPKLDATKPCSHDWQHISEAKASPKLVNQTQPRNTNLFAKATARGFLKKQLPRKQHGVIYVRCHPVSACIQWRLFKIVPAAVNQTVPRQ